MEQEKEKPEDQSINNEVTDTQQEPSSGGSADTEINEVDKLSAELAEAKDKYLRLYADFENFRRRTAKEKLDYIKSANEEMILSILPVVDDFERAQKSLQQTTDIDTVKEGLQLIFNKLYKTLEQKGLKPMDSVGKDFNPELHESITQAPAPSEELKGKIMDEVEKGYFLHEKVIRFAKVIIGA